MVRKLETVTVFGVAAAVVLPLAYGLTHLPSKTEMPQVSPAAKASPSEMPVTEQIPPMPQIPHAFSVVPKGYDATPAAKVTAARVLVARWSKWKAKPTGDPIPYADWANARVNLTSIKSGMQEFADAKALATQLDAIGPALADAESKVADKIRARERERDALALVNDTAGRRSYAKTLENNFLRNNMDATVRAEGSKDTTLRVKYIGFSRPLMFKLQEEGKLIPDIIAAAKAHGFRKLIMEDGYRYSWNWDLSKP
ncbi:MAG: hypothetical protein J0H40_17940 [Rhizobiales bacterium]|nr:hypothetical protein [Hyphomicrobiales bacterium]